MTRRISAQRARTNRIVKRAQRRLAAERLESRQMLSNILALSPEGISFMQEGRLKWSNPAMAEMIFHCGVSIETLYGPNGSGAGEGTRQGHAQ